jgi:uncharacterized membrane protein (GlpM family)
MEVVIQHLKEHYGWYVFGLICVLPPFVLLRRYTVAPVMYAVELVIYMGLLHCLIYGVVVVAAWFKDQSTLKRARGLVQASFNPGWKTPLLRFWDRQQYDPPWLLYFELVLLVVVIFLMWRYRPLKRTRRKPPPSKKKPGPGYNYRRVK